MAQSKLFDTLSTSAKAKVNAAKADITAKVTSMKNAFIITGQDIIGTGVDVGRGVLGAVIEANDILTDLNFANPMFVTVEQARVMVSRVQSLMGNAKTKVDASPLYDATIQHIINENLRMAMEASQEAIDSALDELNRATLMDKMNAVKESVTTATEQIKEGIVSDASAIKAHVATIKGAIYDAWMKGNFGQTSHPDGYALTSNALKGAKEAMNDKYGEGSVVW